MNVRIVHGKEKQSLRPGYYPWGQPWRRVLDFEEQREMLHLFRTKQATPDELALRFGISRRTVYRYHRDYPETPANFEAAQRLMLEAARMGMTLSPDDAVRLAAAALSGTP